VLRAQIEKIRVRQQAEGALFETVKFFVHKFTYLNKARLSFFLVAHVTKLADIEVWVAGYVLNV
jgi:hypothetical protein